MTAAPQRATWVSAHVFHAGDLDALITQVAGPVAAELGPRGFFFLRYWEGGPHLRIRVLAAGPRQASQFRHELSRHAQGYLGTHPSSRAITDADYAATAARQARGERLTRHDGLLHANDTVEFIAYRPEHHAYGDAACMRAVERHFTQSSRLALTVLRGPLERGRRAATALAALTITLAACRTDPSCLPGDLPPAADAIYRAHGDALRRQALRLWTGAAGHPLAPWSRSVRALRDALTQARCTPQDPGSPLGFLARAAPPGHRPVAEVLLRCTHLLNNRIGLPAAAEHEAALLSARILSDLSAKGEIT